LKGYLLSPERIAEYLQKAHTTINEKSVLLQALTKELERVRAEADMVYRFAVDGKITGDQLKDRYQPLDERRIQIEAEIPKVEADLSLLRIDGLSSE
jgi:site-specific DNA recombinase